MKTIVIKILVFLSKRIINKYQPKIVGITGSVGKTTTKEAIYLVLSRKFNVRKNFKNYNNEFGVPLTIIGAESGNSSLLGWLSVILHAFKLILTTQKYPEILVLEMGADKPGDIEYLTKHFPPTVGVLTAVSEAHLEQFKNLDGVLKEKEKIVTRLKDGRAVVNFDDPYAIKALSKIKTNLTTYGFKEGADVRAVESSVIGLSAFENASQQDWDDKEWGTAFKVSAFGSAVPIFLPHVLSRAQVYAVLAAISVGHHFELNLMDIIDSLKNFHPEKGRMHLLAGIKHSILIDDTYNSSPAAAMLALNVLKSLPINTGSRRIAVMGSMLELGEQSGQLHANVGRFVYEQGIDVLVGVGQESHSTCLAAKEAGMDEATIFHYDASLSAGEFLRNYIQEGDIVLVKGSQGARMEKTLREILADPTIAGDLLVRQTEEWLRK